MNLLLVKTLIPNSQHNASKFYGFFIMVLDFGLKLGLQILENVGFLFHIHNNSFYFFLKIWELRVAKIVKKPIK